MGAGKGGESSQRLLRAAETAFTPFSFEDEAVWAKVAKSYSVTIGKANKTAVGVVFVQKVNDVLEGLGEHLLGANKHAESGGDPNAFAKFFKQMKTIMPRTPNEVTL